MGEIIHSKILPDNKVLYKVLLDEEELKKLKGHLKNVHVFSSKLCKETSQINTRGNKGVTKYFKIPLSIRSRKRYHGKLAYQKLDTPSKVFFIYTLDKDETNN